MRSLRRKSGWSGSERLLLVHGDPRTTPKGLSCWRTRGGGSDNNEATAIQPAIKPHEQSTSQSSDKPTKKAFEQPIIQPTKQVSNRQDNYQSTTYFPCLQAVYTVPSSVPMTKLLESEDTKEKHMGAAVLDCFCCSSMLSCSEVEVVKSRW